MNTSTIKISEPQTPKQFEVYYLLRYELLRKPWNQPEGSEKDEMEEHCIHAMATDSNNRAIGVCRLQLNSPLEAQIRFMAVADDVHGLGVGSKLIAYMENKAKGKGVQKIILQSREKAVGFYIKCGYSLIEKSYLMWGEIQHFLMSKEIG